MIFLIYIILIIVMGVFFFAASYSKGNNPMLFTLLFSIFGLAMLFNSPPELITGTNTTLIKDSFGITTGSISNYITEPFTVFSFDTTNFFALIFIAFFLLSIVNIYFNEDRGDMNIRE